jgi:serine/threonine protein phosphatase PrpC
MAEGAPSILFAKANRESKKGEDFACTIKEGEAAPAAFAIFDGHSGKDTARICSEVVCQRLMKKGPPFKEEDIIDTLWSVDEEIGKQKYRDGATAQILLVEQSGDTFKCTIAWCGDSSLIVCDATGKVVFSTDSHTAGPDHQGGGSWQSEKLILERYVKVRKAVEDTAKIDTVREDTTTEMVHEAIKSLGEEPKQEEVALMVRALRRGKIVADVYWEMNPDKKNEEYVRKNLHVRQRDKDHDENQVWVVATRPTRDMPGYSDVQMTRSMCDWKAADLILPHPQIHTFEVPATEVYRICLASDGLWDICPFEKCGKVLEYSKTVQGAAKDLLSLAEEEDLQTRKHDSMDDDTTILVVELNPSGMKRAGGGGGCCSVM